MKQVSRRGRARLRDVLQLISPAVADQLEAMKVEVERLRTLTSHRELDSTSVARSGNAGAFAVVKAEWDATCRKLGQTAKYADDLDANGGPEDGGSYVYLEVAKVLRNILRDVPDRAQRGDAERLRQAIRDAFAVVADRSGASFA